MYKTREKFRELKNGLAKSGKKFIPEIYKFRPEISFKKNLKDLKENLPRNSFKKIWATREINWEQLSVNYLRFKNLIAKKFR